MKKLGILAILLAATLFWTLGPNLEQLAAQREQWASWYAANPAAATCLYGIAYIAITALSLPGAATMTLGAGALFGTPLGVALVSLASTIGCTLAFLSARFLLRDWVQRRFAKQLDGINRGLRHNGIPYLLTLRLIPAFPFFLVNLAMGLSSMPLRTYALVSLVGMLPGTLVWVNAGARLGSLSTPQDVLAPEILLSLALLAALPWLIKLGINWRK